MARTKFAVIGVGKYGSAIARELASKGAEVYAFDISSDKIELLKEDVALAVAMDTTDKRALQSQKVNDVDAAIVAIGENFEATVLSTLNLLDMGIPRVIARAGDNNQYRILEKLGVKEILLPEAEVAGNISEKLLNPNITAFLQLPDNYEIAEIKVPSKVANRSLEDIDLINKYSLTLITLKREFEVDVQGEVGKEEHIIGVPKSETILYDSDTLVVFGTLNDIKRFIEINS